jgi:serine acetyltransferase
MYAGAKILGNIKIGNEAFVGAGIKLLEYEALSY